MKMIPGHLVLAFSCHFSVNFYIALLKDVLANYLHEFLINFHFILLNLYFLTMHGKSVI